EVWRRLVTAAGVLIVADVIPPDDGILTDTRALLHYAARNRFLLAAIVGMGRTVFSRYRELRARLGIARYGEAEFLAKLAAGGFARERPPFNLQPNPAALAF